MKNVLPTPIDDWMTMLHDAVCEKWTFDYTRKELILFFQSDDGEKHRMIYRGVYAHQMVSCDFWGRRRIFTVSKNWRSKAGFCISS